LRPEALQGRRRTLWNYRRAERAMVGVTSRELRDGAGTIFSLLCELLGD
jgi:hypothetical protein